MDQKAEMSFLDRFLWYKVLMPSPGPHDADVEGLASRLALYHFDSCPFCLRVRRELVRLGVEIELRNIHRDHSRYDELVRGGGKQQVPCLRIENDDGTVEWLYESSDIIVWLQADLFFPGSAEAV